MFLCFKIIFFESNQQQGFFNNILKLSIVEDKEWLILIWSMIIFSDTLNNCDVNWNYLGLTSIMYLVSMMQIVDGHAT